MEVLAELLKAPVLAKISESSQVSCGVDFTVWLCKGQLYSAGNPQYGQLGHGTDHEYNAKDCKQAAPSILLLMKWQRQKVSGSLMHELRWAVCQMQPL